MRMRRRRRAGLHEALDSPFEGGIKIGLEVHCQLTSLKTKLFCNCSSDYRGKEANSTVCPVCMGLPGAMPSLNERALDEALKVVISLKSRPEPMMLFFRKNYFYPDMPKNFQISQYDGGGGVPLAKGGCIELQGGKRIRVRRVQLEEDPGKLSYEGTIASSASTLVDYNRAGVALLEIVTEPDMTSPKEARLFLQKLRSILEHLGVSDPSLDGAMRCDANISVPSGGRVEVKNVTSFKEVERALNFEIARQKARVRGGMKVERETRHWDEVRRVTVSLRAKEEEEDYRYFPEPDLPPVVIGEDLFQRVARKVPELPDVRAKRFVETYGLSKNIAESLTNMKRLADLLEETASIYKNSRRVASWLVTEVLGYLNLFGLELSQLNLKASDLAYLLDLVDRKEVSEKNAKEILYEAMKTNKGVKEIVERKGLRKMVGRDEIVRIVKLIFEKNGKVVQDALVNPKAANFLIGLLMKETKGAADPRLAREVILSELDGERARV